MNFENEWESFVLRMKDKAASVLYRGRRGKFAAITAYMVSDYDGKPVLWVVSNEEVRIGYVSSGRVQWRSFIDFVRGEARDTLNKSRHGLCIISVRLTVDSDGALHEHEIGEGMRIEPSNKAKAEMERILRLLS